MTQEKVLTYFTVIFNWILPFVSWTKTKTSISHLKPSQSDGARSGCLKILQPRSYMCVVWRYRVGRQRFPIDQFWRPFKYPLLPSGQLLSIEKRINRLTSLEQLIIIINCSFAFPSPLSINPSSASLWKVSHSFTQSVGCDAQQSKSVKKYVGL